MVKTLTQLKESEVEMVLALPMVVRRFLSKVEVQDDGCWLWKGAKFVGGYGMVDQRDGTTRKTWYAHRLMWTFLWGAIPPGGVICHKCDHPLCVRPFHLFLGTPDHNSHDMVLKGRQGGKPRKQVLTIRDV